MHDLLPQLSEIADKIKNLEDSREKLGKFLREISDSVELEGEVLEKKLIHKVSADGLDEKSVVAIDGGLSQHEYHGLDLILTRAVAVVFNYKTGKLDKVGYHPHAIVTPKLIVVSDPYNDEEFAMSSSLERQRGEVDLATECFSKFSPQIVLMDGMIVPHGNDKPQKNSPAFGRYQLVIQSFKNLYVNSKGSLLAGCVEDSRGRRFCEIIAEKILGQIESPRVPELQKILAGTRDTNLLFHCLQHGERTAVFKFSSQPSQHPVLSDLGPAGEKIFSFYLKSAEFDRPVRVDFFADANPIETANKIAALVLAMSPHSSYGFPAPLIEADLRAKLQEGDANSLHDQLVDRIGIVPSLMKLRREQRPF